MPGQFPPAETSALDKLPPANVSRSRDSKHQGQALVGQRGRIPRSWISTSKYPQLKGCEALPGRSGKSAWEGMGMGAKFSPAFRLIS